MGPPGSSRRSDRPFGRPPSWTSPPLQSLSLASLACASPRVSPLGVATTSGIGPVVSPLHRRSSALTALRCCHRRGPCHRSRSHPAFGFSPPGGLPVLRGCVLACGLVASRCWPWGSPRFRPSCPRHSFTTSRWRRPVGSRSSSSRRWTLRSLSLTRSRGRVTDASLPNRRSPSSALPSCRYRAHPASCAPVHPPVTRFPSGSAPRLRGPPTPPHATVSSPGSVKVRRPRVSPTRASDRLPGRSPRCPPSTAAP